MQIYVWLDQSTNKYLKVRNRDVMYSHDISFEKIEKQSKKCQQIKRWVKCIFIQGKHKSISSIIIKLSNEKQKMKNVTRETCIYSHLNKMKKLLWRIVLFTKSLQTLKRLSKVLLINKIVNLYLLYCVCVF